MQKNPKKVLELGSGKSTIAITRWLHKLNGSHAVVSMDEYEKWGNLTTENLNRLSIEHNTEVIISERVDSSVGFFLGTKYKAIPKHNYDLIFIDGPDPKGGINIDAIDILSKQEAPCDIIVDGRFRTVLALQALFPKCRSFKFINNMTLFEGVCKNEFTENNFSHIHYGKFKGFDPIIKSISKLSPSQK